MHLPMMHKTQTEEFQLEKQSNKRCCYLYVECGNRYKVTDQN